MHKTPIRRRSSGISLSRQVFPRALSAASTCSGDRLDVMISFLPTMMLPQLPLNGWRLSGNPRSQYGGHPTGTSARLTAPSACYALTNTLGQPAQLLKGYPRTCLQFPGRQAVRQFAVRGSFGSWNAALPGRGRRPGGGATQWAASLALSGLGRWVQRGG